MRAQAFGKAWNAVKGQRISYVDIKAQEGLGTATFNLGTGLDLKDCHEIKNHETHDACIVPKLIF